MATFGRFTKSKAEAIEAVFSRFDCKHECTTVRARKVAGGGAQYCEQCQRCGERIGRAIGRSELNDEPPPFDENMARDWSSRRKHAYELVDQEYASAFWDDYAGYLKSAAWAGRRRLVMARAGGLCEGCRTQPATVVHHLTYEHVGREFLFELVALCDECHDVCHPHKAGPA